MDSKDKSRELSEINTLDDLDVLIKKLESQVNSEKYKDLKQFLTNICDLKRKEDKKKT